VAVVLAVHATMLRYAQSPEKTSKMNQSEANWKCVWSAPESELTYGQRAGRVAGGVDASSLKSNCLRGRAHRRLCNITMVKMNVKRNVCQSPNTTVALFSLGGRVVTFHGTCVSLMIAAGIGVRSHPLPTIWFAASSHRPPC
jgi:hypothetical protein